jgi:hypothetical protein
VLEAVNLALNPFDEHYVDRDLSRTGLAMCVITPGTGHFAVDKNLLRLTTERMIDHGIALDLVCLTKMPLHSVPLFSYVAQKPKGIVVNETSEGTRTKPGTPDLLYFDAHMSAALNTELADCYCKLKHKDDWFRANGSHSKMGRMLILLENTRQAVPPRPIRAQV